MILLVTGSAKIWSAFGHARVLAFVDPLSGLTLGHVMVTVGILELVVAIVCIFSKSIQLAIGLSS